jgi:peptide chain release factor 3
VAVVGVLQFEVMQARLESEYNVETRLNNLPHSLCRIVEGPPELIDMLPWQYSMIRTQDQYGNLVALMNSEHDLNYYDSKYPELTFREIR